MAQNLFRMAALGVLLGTFAVSLSLAQQTLQDVPTQVNESKFKQLGQELPTPNVYRTASGAPGHEYWQQQVDYNIQVTLDDENQRIDGEERILYKNNSPDELRYLWLQLDQNVRALDSDSYKIRESRINGRSSFGSIQGLEPSFDGGFKIQYVGDETGKPLKYTINKTMMRIDLPSPLKPGGTFVFDVAWWYNINDRMKDGGRSGYEYFEDEDNYLYTCLLYTSPSPRDLSTSRMPSSA